MLNLGDVLRLSETDGGAGRFLLLTCFLGDVLARGSPVTSEITLPGIGTATSDLAAMLWSFAPRDAGFFSGGAE